MTLNETLRYVADLNLVKFGLLNDNAINAVLAVNKPEVVATFIQQLALVERKEMQDYYLEQLEKYFKLLNLSHELEVQPSQEVERRYLLAMQLAFDGTLDSKNISINKLLEISLAEAWGVLDAVTA